MRSQLATVPGLVDLSVEKQVLIPQIVVRLDHRKAAQLGLSPGEAIRILQTLTDGAHGAQIVEGARRYQLVLRLPDDRRGPQDLARTLIDTPAGRMGRTRSAGRMGVVGSSSMPTPMAATWAA
jgi:Cu/Ag efflux pump CusA